MAVILSAAKDLSRIAREILRCAQDDNQENGQVNSAQILGWPMASAVGDANSEVGFVFPTSQEVGHPIKGNPSNQP